ncbi:MAG: methyltransferase domain-containing protein [Candidatus Humimicrobiaceae bacterium]
MLIDKLDLYLEEKKFLKGLEEKSRSQKIPVISVETGAFLEFAVLIKKPNKILEIGCGNGFSTYFLVKNLQSYSSYTGIDLNKVRLSSAESFIKERFKGIEMEFISGNALEVIVDLDGKFDLVFIDAAKFEYPGYLDIILKKLNKGALIIADNIFYNGKIFSQAPSKHNKKSIEGIKEYLEMLNSNNGIIKTDLIDIGDGLAISIYGEGTDGQ